MVASQPHKTMPEEAEPDPLQASIDALIAGCGGNLSAALRAVVEENIHLREELELTRAAVSSGYSRQWHHRRAEAE